MTRILPLLLALAVAGCLGQPSATTDDTNTTMPDDAPMWTVPAPIEDTKQVSGSADPMNFITGAPCNTPTAQCFPYPFTLEGTATITSELTWGQPASDFDFYVMQDGAVVLNGASDVSAGPGTSERIEGELTRGDYEIVVVAWSVAQDTYTLTASFAADTDMGEMEPDTNATRLN